jgi:hypothetical protein
MRIVNPYEVALELGGVITPADLSPNWWFDAGRPGIGVIDGNKVVTWASTGGAVSLIPVANTSDGGLTGGLYATRNGFPCVQLRASNLDGLKASASYGPTPAPPFIRSIVFELSAETLAAGGILIDNGGGENAYLVLATGTNQLQLNNGDTVNTGQFLTTMSKIYRVTVMFATLGLNPVYVSINGTTTRYASAGGNAVSNVMLGVSKANSQKSYIYVYEALEIGLGSSVKVFNQVAGYLEAKYEHGWE